MPYKSVLLFSLLVHFVSSLVEFQHKVEQEHEQCPRTWTYYNNKTRKCECGSEIKKIIKFSNPNNCNNTGDQNTIQVLACYCMTYSEILNTTVAGYCLYSCGKKYYSAPSPYTRDLTEDTCGRLHREGQLCGKCKPGYSPPVYSYSSCCVNCTDYRYNWLKYIAVAYVPLTIFYGGMITFRVSATSPKMVSYILISQIAATPAQLRYIYSMNENNRCIISPTNHTAIQIVASLYAIWNLDFFRSLYHPFCLHPNMTTVQVIALDYIIAVYPLGLIIVTYLLVILHDRFPTIARLMRPLGKYFSRFRRQNDIRSSLIDAFATFILLSYMKILNVSFDLLTNTRFYDETGKSVANYLYYNGTQEMFHGEHTWYAILAFFMLLFFTIMPLLLLCLYPFQCFQKCLNCFRVNNFILHTFMDSFNGHYKTKPKDLRSFAGFYLLIRIASLGTFSLFANRYYLLFEAMLFLCAAFLIATVRPYKSVYANNLDIFFLSTISLCYIALGGYNQESFRLYGHLFEIMQNIAIAIAPLYAIGVITHKLILLKIHKAWQNFRKRDKNIISDHEPLVMLPEESRHTYTENSLLLASTHRVVD